MLWKYCKRSTFFFNSSHVISATTIFFPPIFGNSIATNFFSLFRQWHCHNCQKKISPISVMPLPQLVCHNFFWTNNNWLRVIYCENVVKILWTKHFFFFTLPQISKPLFFPPFSAMPLPQLLNFFLFPHFNNGIATINLSKFFFFFLL